MTANQQNNYDCWNLTFFYHDIYGPFIHKYGLNLPILSQIMLAVVAIVLGTFLFLWAFKKLSRKADQLPPGPLGLPIVGYLPFLGPNLHQLFVELAQIYGPIYKLSIGQKLCVVISSPTLAKQVLRDQDAIFANRNATIAASTFALGRKDIACAPYGPDWRLLRKIFTREMLSHSNLNALYSVRSNEVKKSVRDVFDKIGQPINVGELAFSTVINMMSCMFWGVDAFESKGEICNAVEFRNAALELIELIGKPNVSDFFPVLARFDLQGVKRDVKKELRQIEKLYGFVIDQWIEKDKIRGSDQEAERKDLFLHHLLQFKEQDTGRSISREQIKALIMDAVIGGGDSTSNTIVWVMAEMMRHPEVVRKVQQELTEIVGVDDIVEEFHIRNLPYLNAVVKETLRLHPLAPLLLPRCPTRASNIGGYTIPKGTTVFLNTWAMHRDPKFWDNPTEFQPQRFFESPNQLDYSGNRFHYLPFGSGRRICAGFPLAERMLMHVLATFLHMYEWKLPHGAKPDTSERFRINLQKATPLILIPTPRLSNFDLYAYKSIDAQT